MTATATELRYCTSCGRGFAGRRGATRCEDCPAPASVPAPPAQPVPSSLTLEQAREAGWTIRETGRTIVSHVAVRRPGGRGVVAVVRGHSVDDVLRRISVGEVDE